MRKREAALSLVTKTAHNYLDRHWDVFLGSRCPLVALVSADNALMPGTRSSAPKALGVSWLQCSKYRYQQHLLLDETGVAAVLRLPFEWVPKKELHQ